MKETPTLTPVTVTDRIIKIAFPLAFVAAGAVSIARKDYFALSIVFNWIATFYCWQREVAWSRELVQLNEQTLKGWEESTQQWQEMAARIMAHKNH